MKKVCIVITGVIFCISCKTTSKMQPAPTVKTSVPSLKKENLRSLAAKIKANTLNYKWISARLSIQLQIDSDEHSFNAYTRIRKDSAIWLSLSKIGIKGDEVLLTQDSVMRIDYLHDTYSRNDYDFINNQLDEDLDYDMVQSVMLGGNMEFYNDTSKMKSYFDGKQYIISTIRKRKLRKVLYRKRPFHSKDDAQFIFLDTNTFRITHIRVEDFVNNRTFDAYYSDFQKIDSVMFPMHIQYVISAEKTIKINLHYKKVLFKSHEDIPFFIPKKYEQVQY